MATIYENDGVTTVPVKEEARSGGLTESEWEGRGPPEKVYSMEYTRRKDRQGMSAATNIYGYLLQPCRPRNAIGDNGGSWDPDSGACAGDGIHSVCVSSLPADFCRKTGQGNDKRAWCAKRRGQPHCVCQGAFAMYAARSREEGRGKELPLKCSAIHGDVLRDLKRQAALWRDGFGGNVLPALQALHGSCAAGTAAQQKRLSRRICKIYEENASKNDLKKDNWYQKTCPQPARNFRKWWPWRGR